MIVEALIGGATVCFCASLQFTKWVLRREDVEEPRNVVRAAFKAKRDVQREELAAIRTYKHDGNRLKYETDVLAKIAALHAEELAALRKLDE